MWKVSFTLPRPRPVDQDQKPWNKTGQAVGIRVEKKAKEIC